MNMHVGNMGVAPAVGAAVITGPPMRTGGNIDDRRIGIGGMAHAVIWNGRFLNAA